LCTRAAREQRQPAPRAAQRLGAARVRRDDAARGGAARALRKAETLSLSKRLRSADVCTPHRHVSAGIGRTARGGRQAVAAAGGPRVRGCAQRRGVLRSGVER